jgi:hypothetical protein
MTSTTCAVVGGAGADRVKREVNIRYIIGSARIFLSAGGLRTSVNRQQQDERSPEARGLHTCVNRQRQDAQLSRHSNFGVFIVIRARLLCNRLTSRW